MLGGTREQRQKRPPCRVWAPGPAIEPRLYPSALQRVLEQTEVVLRRADENRHLVESDARSRMLEDATSHLDAFAPLSRRRKELQGTVECAAGRFLRGVEEKSPQERQVGRPATRPLVECCTHRRQVPDRVAIAVRNCRHDRGCPFCKRLNERTPGGVLDRDIEQQDEAWRCGLAQQFRRGAEEVSSIERGGISKARVEALEQPGEIGSGRCKR